MDLLITQEPISRCVRSGERLGELELALDVLTPQGVAEITIVLDYAHNSKTAYLPMEDLMDLAQDIGCAIYEIEGFRTQKELINVYLSSEEGQVAWSGVREQIAGLAEQPSVSFAEAKARPMSKMVWELKRGAGAWIEDLGDGEGGFSYIYLLADSETELILGMEMSATGVNQSLLNQLIFKAIVYPAGQADTPLARRPKLLRVHDDELLALLEEPMKALGVSLEFGPTAVADIALASLFEHLGINQIPSFFANYDEGELRSFFDVSDVFFEAEPWERFSGTKYVAFRFSDKPDTWHYCNIMGQAGQEFGLAMFPDWLVLCKFVHNQPTPMQAMMGIGVDKQLLATGGNESLMLTEAAALNPEDGAYLERLGIVYEDDMYPVVMKFNAEGLEAPTFTLNDYKQLMQGIVAVLENRRAATIASVKKSFEFNGRKLDLIYPAKGDEALKDIQTSYLLKLNAKPEGEGKKLPKVKKYLLIEASGDTTVHKLAVAIRDFLGGFYITGCGYGFELLEMDEFDADFDEDDFDEDDDTPDFSSFFENDSRGVMLWTDRNEGHYGPHLRLSQLEGMSDLWLEQFHTLYPLSIERTNKTLKAGEISISKE